MAKKQLGCLSPLGLLVALAVVLSIAGYRWMAGDLLFSPGQVSAARPLGNPLEGFDSHAQFESQCERCHSAWQGADSGRCLACHTNVQEQIVLQTGLHSRLQEPAECLICHSEHLGRDGDISAAARAQYPHNQVGFSLAGHRESADGRAFRCADCHTGAELSFDRGLCESCHAGLDADFVDQHVADTTRDCLACHDGSGALANFDHNAHFALTGGHSELDCASCHGNEQYRNLPADCAACHEEPQLHRSQFGTDCAACHSAATWAPARLRQHDFPLDHGEGGEAACQTCHPADYVSFTCFNCHDHEPSEIDARHEARGLAAAERCIDCHPTGRGDEGSDDDA